MLKDNTFIGDKEEQDFYTTLSEIVIFLTKWTAIHNSSKDNLNVYNWPSHLRDILLSKNESDKVKLIHFYYQPSEVKFKDLPPAFKLLEKTNSKDWNGDVKEVSSLETIKFTAEEKKMYDEAYDEYAKEEDI